VQHKPTKKPRLKRCSYPDITLNIVKLDITKGNL